MELLDFGNHPIIDGDDVGDVLFIGDSVRYIVFRWKRIDGILRRVICGEVTIPASTLPPARRAELRAKFQPSEEMVHH